MTIDVMFVSDAYVKQHNRNGPGLAKTFLINVLSPYLSDDFLHFCWYMWELFHHSSEVVHGLLIMKQLMGLSSSFNI